MSDSYSFDVPYQSDRAILSAFTSQSFDIRIIFVCLRLEWKFIWYFPGNLIFIFKEGIIFEVSKIKRKFFTILHLPFVFFYWKALIESNSLVNQSFFISILIERFILIFHFELWYQRWECKANFVYSNSSFSQSGSKFCHILRSP